MRPPRVSRAWKRVSKKVFVHNAVYHTTIVATTAATVASLVRTSRGQAESFLLLLVEIRLVFTRS